MGDFIGITTIQVKGPTLQRLRQVRERTKSASYDEAINKLMENKKRSMWGALSGGKKYTAKFILDGLRDEVDRI